MKEDRITDMMFIFHIAVVIAPAFIYFSAPERADIIRNALDWWSSALDMIM